MSLMSNLQAISGQVQKQRDRMNNNEEITKQVSIKPFIRALGYNTDSPDEVYPEYAADPRANGNNRVDYAIMQDEQLSFFVEAKAAGISLNENHWRQLHDYFCASDVKFAILTNGIEYRCYTDCDKPNVMDQSPFFTINITDIDPKDINILEGFTKPNFCPTTTSQHLKLARYIEQECAHPSDEFVKHFAKYLFPRITGKVIRELRPKIIKAFSDHIDGEIVSRVQRKNGPENGHSEQPAVPEQPELIAPRKRRRTRSGTVNWNWLHRNIKGVFLTSNKHADRRFGYVEITADTVIEYPPMAELVMQIRGEELRPNLRIELRDVLPSLSVDTFDDKPLIPGTTANTGIASRVYLRDDVGD